MPTTQVVLDTFGGLVATARPEDLPEGASPRTYDTDFAVGCVMQRPGVQSVYGAGVSSANFKGMVSAKLNDSDQVTVALDDNGAVWQEDVTNAPNVLSAAAIPNVPAGSYLKGIQAGESAYLAFSNLEHGTAAPMQYNGQWCDRITQVGPGAPPVFTASTLTGTAATVTAYAYSSGILTLTSTNTFTAGELVTFSGFSTGCAALNGKTFSVLGTGLSGSQFQISSTAVSGTGSDSGTATPQYAYPIVASPNGITQPAQQSDPSDAGHFQALLWSAGPGSRDSGSTITVYYSQGAVDQTLVNAFNSGYPLYVYVSTAPFGNGTWQVTSIGKATPPGGSAQRWYFTYQVPTSNYQFYGGPDNATGYYQITQATVTLTTPVPGLTAGAQVSLANVTAAAWNGLYDIVRPIASGSFAISQTQVSGGTATYTWALQSGAAPVAGQLVTITNTLNAGGQLNVTDAVIASATGTTSGTFTVNGFPNSLIVGVAVEAGQATTAGTQFIIDPGAALVGTATQSPILGNSGGGTLSIVGSSLGSTFPIGAGTRQGVVFFITRNGAVTRPSPPTTFTVTNGANYITASQIPIGPPNVVARGIAFTEAGQNGVPGANFYTYDTPVTFTVGGVTFTASALIVPDNTTTTAKFTFSDAVLLSSDEIDTQGNNYFNLMEIGEPAWMFQYANRMLYGLCRTKVQNLLNPTFDGGYLAGQDNPMPLGWKAISGTQSTSVGLAASAVFGNSLVMLNTDNTVWTADVLFQGAYQDVWGAPILSSNTAYSVRVQSRARGLDGQSFSIKLRTYADGSFGPVDYGTFTATVNRGGLVEVSGPLTSGISTVPSALQLVLSVSGVASGAGVEIDRIDIFPTNRPVDTTTIWCSYPGNFEAVDQVTGSLGVGADNAQPAQGAYQILEQLFIEKTNSLQVTQDSPNYEPNQWNVHQASDRAGSCGPNAYDEGEEGSLSACRNGVYFFNGGKKETISRELQGTGLNGSAWEKINWDAASAIWLRNDLLNRRFYIGVPMITPNFWLPNAPSATPISPNVILMCNYSGCPSGEEMMMSTPVHTTMFGDLKALDMRRKWSIWQIPCPVAEFVSRPDGITDEFLMANGNGSGKLFNLVAGSTNTATNNDDGAPINWNYTTYGFTGARQGQQNPMLGALRKLWTYLATRIQGVGKVACRILPNTLGTAYPFTVPLPFSLSYPAENDHERVLESSGQRVFLEFSPVGSNGYAEIQSIIMDGQADRVHPHRGVAQ